ncbi:cytochrome b-c1 complex subunit 2, mitochondrial-like [Dendronephthya gigantea]|uniref:cytochrome b-c1 complex subunit 2, mitochondrial-like n=1 Tax=Dendronephthya gigantea TaxID=151771 RepID=UPI00106ABA84|nr:cytochrome b-c1 complex subunit 2, mitochondrial-like [Dendronephthya gigantea]
MHNFLRLVSPISRSPRLELSRIQVRRLAVCVTPLSEPLDDLEVDKPTPVPYSSDVQVTTLSNGLKVASVDCAGPTARIGLFFKSGSRYESFQESGISHVLRVGAFLTTSDHTGFHISRTMEENGINLEASSTREQLVYSAQCLKDDVGLLIPYLSNVVAAPEFRQWELEDIVENIELDLAMAKTNPQIGLIEELHRVAYRNGLRNSIYCKPSKTNKFTTEMLLKFTKDSFVGNQMALVGVGVNHDSLVGLCKSYLSGIPAGNSAIAEKPIYSGGEVHCEQPQNLVHVALACEGASIADKNYLAFGVLQRVLGVTPFIKWGTNTTSSRINKAVQGVTDGPFMGSTININYSDSGLFGFYAAASPKDATKVTRAIVDQFSKISKGDVSKEEIERAKNQLKSSIQMANESYADRLEDIGTQVLQSGSYTSPDACSQSLDKITSEDVVNAAKQIFAKRASLAVMGESEALPHLEDLL